jgi:hypothetical protein
MAEFINTIDILGDEAVIDSIIDRSITELCDNTIESVGNGAFRNCEHLAVLDLPAAKSTASESFRQCHALVGVKMPSMSSVGYMSFYSCWSLKTVDLPVVKNIADGAFGYCGSFKALVLRADAVCALGGAWALEGTAIKKGTGYIYVPAALKEQYAQSTNWSVYAAQFRALEDYTVDGTIWGDLDENKI